MPRSGDYIASGIRALVAKRAGFRCEYCRLPDSLAYYRHQVDHIISLKHRGTNVIDNLAYACFTCNINKGPDVGSIYDETRLYVGFFNPRTDSWDEHFRLDNARIEPLTKVGWVTAITLQFNTPERIALRRGIL